MAAGIQRKSSLKLTLGPIPSLEEIQDLADSHGFNWDEKEREAVVEILGSAGTYEDLPEERQCELTDALEAEAIDYLLNHYQSCH